MLGFRFKAVLWIHGRLLLRCAGRWLQATWNHKEKRCQSTDTWAFITRGTESFIGCAKTWKFPFCFCHLLNYTSKTLEKIVGFGSLSTNSQDSIWGRCLTICISSEISWIPFRYLNSSMKPFHKQRNNSSLTHYEGMSYRVELPSNHRAYLDANFFLFSILMSNKWLHIIAISSVERLMESFAFIWLLLFTKLMGPLSSLRPLIPHQIHSNMTNRFKTLIERWACEEAAQTHQPHFLRRLG